jgi:hypothetical protein
MHGLISPCNQTSPKGINSRDLTLAQGKSTGPAAPHMSPSRPPLPKLSACRQSHMRLVAVRGRAEGGGAHAGLASIPSADRLVHRLLLDLRRLPGDGDGGGCDMRPSRGERAWRRRTRTSRPDACRAADVFLAIRDAADIGSVWIPSAAPT